MDKGMRVLGGFRWRGDLLRDDFWVGLELALGLRLALGLGLALGFLQTCIRESRSGNLVVQFVKKLQSFG